jgi:plasmid stabilization system protein ParE
MSEYQISPEALQDLQAISDFIRADNPEAADRMLDDFFAAFDQLAQWPDLGHVRADLTNRPVRFWPVGSYLVVYRQMSDLIQIAAVLHGARDIPAVIGRRE